MRRERFPTIHPGLSRELVVLVGAGLITGAFAQTGLNAAALTWKPVAGGRYADVSLPAKGRTGFQRMAPTDTGIVSPTF